MKSKTASGITGIFLNKKVNRWGVWYSGSLVLCSKNIRDCVWYVKYPKLH